MKTLIASTLLVAAAFTTQAYSQVDDRTLVTTTTSEDNPLKVNFTVPKKMEAEVHVYSEHCGQTNAKNASVTTQIYTTRGQKVGDEIRFQRPISSGMQEITGEKSIELDAGAYYIAVESHSDGARFVKQGVNISVPETFKQWNHVALAC